MDARSNRARHRVLAWLVFAPCLYFAWHGVRHGLRPDGSDFTIYYEAGRALLEGRDPASVARYLYLPSFAVPLALLSVLPYAAALVLWQLGSLAALAWIVRAIPRILTLDGGRPRPWVAWLPLLVCLRLVDSNLSNGQTNLFVLAALLAALEAWLAARPRRAGVWLGCAAALKVLPVALALVWVVRRERRACASLAVALGVFVVAAPLPFLGARGLIEALANWWHLQVAPYSGSAAELASARSHAAGQSLFATLSRLFGAEDGAPATRDAVLWLARALSVLWLGAWCALLLRSARVGGPLARVREFAFGMCTVLALAPLVHKAHMCWLMLPAALLALDPPTGATTPVRAVRLALGAIGALLIGLTTPTLFGPWASRQALDWNVVFFGVCAFTAGLGVDALSSFAAAPRPGETAAEEPPIYR